MVIQKLYDGILLKQRDLLLESIVFRPDGGPGSKPGFQVLTGSAWSILKKKIKMKLF